MYVVMSDYLNKNCNVLAICETEQKAKDIITDDFKRNYSRHLSLRFHGNSGIVSGYSLGGEIIRYKYVIPFMDQ